MDTIRISEKLNLSNLKFSMLACSFVFGFKRIITKQIIWRKQFGGINEDLSMKIFPLWLHLVMRASH